MYESERLNEQRRRRRQFAIGIGGAALVALCVGAAALFAFGSEQGEPSACVIADVSESTDKARSRYATEFERFATEIGSEGSGELCLILAAADPLSEGTPTPGYVGPDPGDADKPQAIGQIEDRVRLATNQFSQLLANPPVDEAGSALVEAATVAGDVLEPGDRLLFLSDGFQWTREVGHLEEIDLTPAAISALIEKLERLNLLPDLDDVTVEFPYMLLHPEDEEPGSNNVKLVQIKAFWEAWEEKTGAELVLPGQS